MRTKAVISKNLKVVSTMPALVHCQREFDGRVVDGWDQSQSEVVKWLVQQPSVAEWLFQAIKWRGLIVFDPETGKWRGQEPPQWKKEKQLEATTAA